MALAAGLADITPSAASAPPVLQPGQEEPLADLLGRGTLLPDGCRLAGGQISGTVAKVTYQCTAGAVSLELHHPSQRSALPNPVAQTNTFVIVASAGVPSPALLDALTTRLRAGESAIRWSQPESVHPPSPTAIPRSSRVPDAPAWQVGGAGLFALLVLAVAVALCRMRASLLTKEALIPALLAALAFGLRCLAHGGPADIRGVLGEPGAQISRAGWASFLKLIYAVLPPADETFWMINRVAGALAVGLLYAIVRRRFADRITAVAAATALAVTPLIVRFSASDTQYILVCSAFLGALVAYDRFVESESVAALVLALALLSAAMQLRPEAPWLIVPAALVALAGPLPRWSAVVSGSTIGACMFFSLFNFAPTLWSVFGHASGGYWRDFVLVGSLVGSPWASADMTPRLLAALVVLGACVAPFYGRPGAMWLLATLVADPLDFPAELGHAPTGHYANARYHLPAMYLACGLAGVGVAALLRLLPRTTPKLVHTLAAVTIVCLAALPRFDLLHRMWTPQSEYEFFRSVIHRVEPGCQVVALANTADSGWAPFHYLVPDGVLDITDFLATPVGGCTMYYRCATCYASDLVPSEEQSDFEMNPACREIEERFRLEPVAEALVPALPYRGETYVRDPIPIGLYRLRAQAPG